MTPEEYYRIAFTRNIGLVSDAEQQRLRTTRAAVVGLGGLGGRHLLDLVRMGIGAFNITDLDEFSLKNINRQVGATSKTVDRPKVEVMAEMARDINPYLDLKTWGNGLREDNATDMLGYADVIIDAIDFFSMGPRLLLYRTARALGKPVVFSAPLGFSGTLHVFGPGSMDFEDYFQITDDQDLYTQLINFAVGLAPAATHLKYMDTSKVDASDHAGPSLSCACDIATGLLTAEVLILLLGRRRPLYAPHYVQFDALTCSYKKRRLLFGNRGPVQRLKRAIAHRRFLPQKALLEAAAGKH